MKDTFSKMGKESMNSNLASEWSDAEDVEMSRLGKKRSSGPGGCVGERALAGSDIPLDAVRRKVLGRLDEMEGREVRTAGTLGERNGSSSAAGGRVPKPRGGVTLSRGQGLVPMSFAALGALASEVQDLTSSIFDPNAKEDAGFEAGKWQKDHLPENKSNYPFEETDCDLGGGTILVGEERPEEYRSARGRLGDYCCICCIPTCCLCTCAGVFMTCVVFLILVMVASMGCIFLGYLAAHRVMLDAMNPLDINASMYLYVDAEIENMTDTILGAVESLQDPNSSISLSMGLGGGYGLAPTFSMTVGTAPSVLNMTTETIVAMTDMGNEVVNTMFDRATDASAPVQMDLSFGTAPSVLNMTTETIAAMTDMGNEVVNTMFDRATNASAPVQMELIFPEPMIDTSDMSMRVDGSIMDTSNMNLGLSGAVDVQADLKGGVGVSLSGQVKMKPGLFSVYDGDTNSTYNIYSEEPED